MNTNTGYKTKKMPSFPPDPSSTVGRMMLETHHENHSRRIKEIPGRIDNNTPFAYKGKAWRKLEWKKHHKALIDADQWDSGPYTINSDTPRLHESWGSPRGSTAGEKRQKSPRKKRSSKKKDGEGGSAPATPRSQPGTPRASNGNSTPKREGSKKALQKKKSNVAPAAEGAGVLTVKVVSGEDVEGNCYVKLTHGEREEKTAPAKDGGAWGDSFDFNVDKIEEETLTLELFDGSDASVGSTKIKPSTLRVSAKKTTEAKLGVGAAKIGVNLSFQPVEEGGEGDADAAPGENLKVVVGEAQLDNEKSYKAKITVDGDTKETAVVKGKTPVWNDTLHFKASKTSSISISIVDEGDSEVDNATYKIDKISADASEVWVPLAQAKKGGWEGQIKLILSMKA